MVRAKRRAQPAYKDGFILGSLWTLDYTLVRLLGSRRNPEDKHISAAYAEIQKAIEIVRKRVRTKT